MHAMLSEKYRRLTLVAVGIIATSSIFMFGRIPQDAAYHRFASAEMLLGIPNFWNVLSNLPFLGVGVFALWRLPRLAERECCAAYFVLGSGIALVGFGSAYYHYAPSNETLLWDRLPMTLAFMALFSMVLGERVITRYRNATLWLLVACGLTAAFYWSWTETNGRGDLRPYAVVQFVPMILLPLIMLLFPRRYLSNRLLFWAFVSYGVAKALEHYDHQVLSVVGTMSGHPLKHVAAAMAALCVVCAVPVGAPGRLRKHAP